MAVLTPVKARREKTICQVSRRFPRLRHPNRFRARAPTTSSPPFLLLLLLLLLRFFPSPSFSFHVAPALAGCRTRADTSRLLRNSQRKLAASYPLTRSWGQVYGRAKLIFIENRPINFTRKLIFEIKLQKNIYVNTLHLFLNGLKNCYEKFWKFVTFTTD